jgi:hypothetical protein
MGRAHAGIRAGPGAEQAVLVPSLEGQPDRRFERVVLRSSSELPETVSIPPAAIRQPT